MKHKHIDLTAPYILWGSIEDQLDLDRFVILWSEATPNIHSILWENIIIDLKGELFNHEA